MAIIYCLTQNLFLIHIIAIALISNSKMIDFSKFDSLISMTMYFNSEDVCKQTIIETRWGVDANEKGQEEPMSYVHAIVVERTDRDTLLPIIGQFVADGSRVITDELSAYNGLSEMGYTHHVVRHGSAEYAHDDILTNSIEGFWSHFRRMISGCYHDVSDEHLQQYIDEAVYRWNTRKASKTERFQNMFNKSIGLVITWNELKLCEAA